MVPDQPRHTSRFGIQKRIVLVLSVPNQGCYQYTATFIVYPTKTEWQVVAHGLGDTAESSVFSRLISNAG